jgi:hypothetical protein
MVSSGTRRSRARLATIAGVLSVALTQGAAAQTTGTIPVTARVLRAHVSWTAVWETARATHDLAQRPAGGPVVRRSALTHTHAVLEPAARGRRLLRVTIQHPYN